jgi:hypothetical protein
MASSSILRIVVFPITHREQGGRHLFVYSNRLGASVRDLAGATMLPVRDSISDRVRVGPVASELLDQ